LGRHAIFRTISQTRIHYPDSSLSQGSAGDIHGGDRLPWTRPPAQNNFDPLRSLDWQAHVYGKTEGELETACRDLQLPLHSFPWSDRANDAGLKKDALYRVRPDGYVALASLEQNSRELRSFVEQFHLRFKN